MLVGCSYHQVEDQGGVDRDGFKQQLCLTVFGFVSQTVQLLPVAVPVSRQQLGLLITAFGLEEGEREKNNKTGINKRL